MFKMPSGDYPDAFERNSPENSRVSELDTEKEDLKQIQHAHNHRSMELGYSSIQSRPNKMTHGSEMLN